MLKAIYKYIEKLVLSETFQEDIVKSKKFDFTEENTKVRMRVNSMKCYL